jgi:uncharacterized glyoxalase superfamily protein PhnB
MQPTIAPFIAYEDPRAAMDWLGAAFGFEPHHVELSPTRDVLHAEMRYGDAIVMLESAAQTRLWGMRTSKELGWPGGQGTYVYVANVDDHYRRALAAGATIVMPPEDMEYGARECAVRDLEGNLWCFGTYQFSRDTK